MNRLNIVLYSKRTFDVKLYTTKRLYLLSVDAILTWLHQNDIAKTILLE